MEIAEKGGESVRRSDKKSKARELFERGERLVDIAARLEIPEGTVRRWKSEDKWGTQADKTDPSEKASDPGEIPENERADREIVRKVIRNQNLSEQQKLFCLYFSRSLNATQSYKKAYGCSYTAAGQSGFQLLKNPKIKAEIDRLKEERFTRAYLREPDIFQKFMDIAFADITDYTDFGTEEIQETDPDTGEKIKRAVNVVRFKDSSEVDGSLITEIKQGRDGASIKLADKIRALEWLADHMGIATDEQRAKVAKLQAEAKLVKAQAEAKEPEEVADDGFLEALNGTAAEDWDEDGV